MIPYCDTPQQSIAIAIFVGVLAGGIGLYVGNKSFVVAVAILLALSVELIVHEYRQDSQYMNAKQSLKDSISK